MIKTMLLLEEDLQKFRAKKHICPRDYLSLLHPRFVPVFLFRVSSCLNRHRCNFLSKFVALINQILFGCDIARGTSIAGGLFMPHPNGVVIGEFVKVGRNCIIYQGVTLGARGEDHETANPRIGNEVEIGSGAKILGKVTVGDNARIGANAVVLQDVPPNGVAVGIPAKIIATRSTIGNP